MVEKLRFEDVKARDIIISFYNKKIYRVEVDEVNSDVIKGKDMNPASKLEFEFKKSESSYQLFVYTHNEWYDLVGLNPIQDDKNRLEQQILNFQEQIKLLDTDLQPYLEKLGINK
ncbi:MAG: hypothetical protein Ta2D_01780 [Rickettsiales bacterium]|nr:MAG: hypothetical protein Ta2D_01780 [Rickettsiales bacterium]